MKKKVIFLDFDGVMETVFQLPLEDATKVKYDKYGPMFDDECVNNLRLLQMVAKIALKFTKKSQLYSCTAEINSLNLQLKPIQ